MLKWEKVNLNTRRVWGSQEQAIIAYREQHGGFRSIEEIMEIEGIKEKLFEKIRGADRDIGESYGKESFGC